MSLPRIPDYALPRDLPVSRAPFVLAPARAALLIHDMQSYFCAAYGEDALLRGESALAQAVPAIGRIAKAARAMGIPVFYTAQKGDQFGPDRGLQGALWGPGMRAIVEHEQIIAPLAPQPGDITLLKHRYSAFQRSNLDHLLRARGRDQLLITGIYAHIGCLATATEAFQRDIEPFFVADALADFSEARHRQAVDWVANCSGVVLGAEQVIASLGDGPCD